MIPSGILVIIAISLGGALPGLMLILGGVLTTREAPAEKAEAGLGREILYECPHCGQGELTYGQSYCNKCGKELSWTPKPSQPT